MTSKQNKTLADSQRPIKRVLDSSLIFLGVVNESVIQAQRGILSKTQLEGIVKKAASDWSAEGELLNLLMRKIPESLEELQSLNKKEDMLLRPKMQYRIWTGDVCKEVEDINEYESKKNSFDFFIDLDEKIHQSLKRLLSLPNRSSQNQSTSSPTRFLVEICHPEGSRFGLLNQSQQLPV